jgi:hypothetical protein
MRFTIFCCMMAMPAFAGDSHLAGTWKGTAEKKVCGQSAGSKELTLSLRDTNEAGSAGVSYLVGALTVGSAKEETVQLLFDSAWHRIQSTRVGTNRSGSLSTLLSPRNELSPYSVLLQGGDRSLSGTLSMRNSACSRMGTEGEVLTVTLKKQ